MTTTLTARFSDDELKVVDRLVAQGVGENRSEVIRLAIARLDEAVRRNLVGEAVARSYRELPQSPEDDALAMANALAMTEAESW